MDLSRHGQIFDNCYGAGTSFRWKLLNSMRTDARFLEILSPEFTISQNESSSSGYSSLGAFPSLPAHCQPQARRNLYVKPATQKILSMIKLNTQVDGQADHQNHKRSRIRPYRFHVQALTRISLREHLRQVPRHVHTKIDDLECDIRDGVKGLGSELHNAEICRLRDEFVTPEVMNQGGEILGHDGG